MKFLQSKPLPSLKLAKRGAAFVAIKKLYECGQLSEHLMPYKGEKCLERFDEVYFNTWDNFKNGIFEKTSKFQKTFVLNPSDEISLFKFQQTIEDVLVRRKCTDYMISIFRTNLRTLCHEQKPNVICMK